MRGQEEEGRASMIILMLLALIAPAHAAEVITCTGKLSETRTMAVIVDPAGYTLAKCRRFCVRSSHEVLPRSFPMRPGFLFARTIVALVLPADWRQEPLCLRAWFS
jgi:hypothetical protein